MFGGAKVEPRRTAERVIKWDRSGDDETIPIGNRKMKDVDQWHLTASLR